MSESMIVESNDNNVDVNEIKDSYVAFEDICSLILFIKRGVELNQPRLLQRAIRQNAVVRRYIKSEQLQLLIKKYFPVDYPTHNITNLIEKIPKSSLSSPSSVAIAPISSSLIVPLPTLVDDIIEPIIESKNDNNNISIMEGLDQQQPQLKVSSSISTADADLEAILPTSITYIPVTYILPEIEIYLCTLIITTLLRYECNLDAAHASTLLIERLKVFNRRSLDLFTSKVYFYLSLSYERIQRLEHIRPTLLLLYRTSCIRHDDIGQAVLLNLLLRNYITFNLIDQAYTLSLRAIFPETSSNNQFCRYLYYMGRIQAIQLEYSEAYQRLMMASRKIPQGYAKGFLIIITKLAILVQLLMGDIPERNIFNQKDLSHSLQPYLILTQAVRTGDLIQFNLIMEKYKLFFYNDKNLTLVERLGHNVLKTGLRKISVSYSRISLLDIAEKLHIKSSEAVEYICAKAIRDGVIEAKIDHENGWLTSHEVFDIYGSEEPQRAFHKRIAFCLDVHNEAVKSMRYPPDDLYSGKNGKKNDKKHDEKTIEELIKDMEEETAEE